jgi:hypothetical protein
MGDDFLGGGGDGPVLTVGKFFQGRQRRLADGNERCSSAFANRIVAVHHPFAENFDPRLDRRVRLRRRRCWLCGRSGRSRLGRLSRFGRILFRIAFSRGRGLRHDNADTEESSSQGRNPDGRNVVKHGLSQQEERNFAESNVPSRLIRFYSARNERMMNKIDLRVACEADRRSV